MLSSTPSLSAVDSSLVYASQSSLEHPRPHASAATLNAHPPATNLSAQERTTGQQPVSIPAPFVHFIPPNVDDQMSKPENLPFAELIGYRPSIQGIQNYSASQSYDGVSSEHYNGEAELGECTVCMDEMKAKELLSTLPCGHHFHHKCIAEWFKTKIQHNQDGNCPCCNTLIVKPQPIGPPPFPTTANLPPERGVQNENEDLVLLFGVRMSRNKRRGIIILAACLIALVLGNLCSSLATMK